ncbi:MAG: type II toxin-antitoxin system HicB family antitoxin [Oscillospiraceae bacterium]|nr:type II toxin-antitoxin system HicB family antitoxin [Oscillospiraceae bacterium]
MRYKFTVIIQKEENWYVAKCAENNVASQGKTLEESIDNLREAVELYYENETIPILTAPVYLSTMEVSI